MGALLIVSIPKRKARRAEIFVREKADGWNSDLLPVPRYT
jgi:hypothetical protein